MEASTSLISRRSLTLYDQLSIVPHHSKNLRDLLKVPDSSDPSPNNPNPNPNPSPNTTWRTLRDLLQLHTNRSSDPVNPNPSAEAEEPESRPVRVPLMALLEQPQRNANNTVTQQSSEQNPEVRDETQEESHAASGQESQSQSQSQSQANEEAMVRVSLMALLEQSERSLNWEGGRGEREEGGEGLASACCVCMVRRKGAAFIPCGHTFCRRCSRELHLTRGTCPLCNGAIAEVLDIF